MVVCATTVSYTYDNPFFPGSSYSETEANCDFYPDPGNDQAADIGGSPAQKETEAAICGGE